MSQSKIEKKKFYQENLAWILAFNNKPNNVTFIMNIQFITFRWVQFIPWRPYGPSGDKLSPPSCDKLVYSFKNSRYLLFNYWVPKAIIGTQKMWAMPPWENEKLASKTLRTVIHIFVRISLSDHTLFWLLLSSHPRLKVFAHWGLRCGWDWTTRCDLLYGWSLEGSYACSSVY